MKQQTQIIDKNRRILNIDILKAFAAFLVCFYHFQLLDFGIYVDSIYVPNLNKVITGICSASVPLFFLLTGVFALQINKGMKYYLTKAFNCIKIYVIWGLLLGVINNLINGRHITFKSIILNIDFLWFFQALSMLYIFSIFFHKQKSMVSINIIMIILLICPFLLNLIYDILVFINPNISPVHTGCLRLYSIVYFLLPVFLKQNISKLTNVLLIIIGLILITFEVYVYSNYYSYIYDGVNSSFPTIGALLITVGIYQLFMTAKFRDNKITHYITFLGRNCLGIYIIHMPLILIYRQFISVEKTSIFIAIILTIITITLSALIYWSLKKIQVIKWTLKL